MTITTENTLTRLDLPIDNGMILPPKFSRGLRRRANQ